MEREGRGRVEQGQALTEYGLILCFIVIVGFVGVQVFGSTFGQFFATAVGKVAAAV